MHQQHSPTDKLLQQLDKKISLGNQSIVALQAQVTLWFQEKPKASPPIQRSTKGKIHKVLDLEHNW